MVSYKKVCVLSLLCKKIKKSIKAIALIKTSFASSWSDFTQLTGVTVRLTTSVPVSASFIELDAATALHLGIAIISLSRSATTTCNQSR